jgi:predicted nucleic acid-binding protein
VIVVTDTSVVLNLCCLREEKLLADIFGTIIAPPAVAREFQRLANVDKRFSRLAFPTFIRIVAPAGVIPSLSGNQKLHAGEIEALSLAIEQKADVVLMDESAGRSIAAGLGLPCIGILGILIQAKRSGLLPEIAPLLDKLQAEAGFWIAPSLRLRVLEMVDE